MTRPAGPNQPGFLAPISRQGGVVVGHALIRFGQVVEFVPAESGESRSAETAIPEPSPHPSEELRSSLIDALSRRIEKAHAELDEQFDQAVARDARHDP
jgi:hypothetical protein